MLAVCTMTACHGGGKDEDSVDSVMRALRDVKESVTGMAPSGKDIQDVANSEVDKLYSIEYKVVELDNSTSPKLLEQTLAQLGQERWECFSIVELGSAYMVTCRRRPTSYLRYALRFLPFPVP